MINTKYERIDFYNLPSDVITNFEHKVLDDNSLLLTRFKTENIAEPELEFKYSLYGGDKVYELNIPLRQRNVEAVVIICRTSVNHYVIVGSTDKYSKTSYGKNLAEVGAFIKRWFCRTLIDL